jgi:hypothetical protein
MEVVRFVEKHWSVGGKAILEAVRLCWFVDEV